jgi:hypothetical protein
MTLPSFLFTLVLICHSFLTSLAAQPIDSLNVLLKSATHDSTRTQLLLQLSAIHAKQDIGLAVNYAEQAIALARNSHLTGVNNDRASEKIREMTAQAEIQRLKLRQSGQITAGIIVGAATLLVFSWLFYRRREHTFHETRRAAELQQQIVVALKDNLRDAQLTAARAQMDPHFVFNAINAIQNLILKENKIEAITYLNDFSKLARQTLDNSSKDSVTINEEIAFLDRYLQLEQLRSGHSFTYKIETTNIEGDYDHIPTMLVQPLVENAIRHGLTSKKEKGTVLVQFTKSESDDLVVIVDDNGVGRAAANEKRSERNHEPRAIHLTELRTRLMSERKARSSIFPVQFEDKLGPDGQPLGTRITLTIPTTHLQFTS